MSHPEPANGADRVRESAPFQPGLLPAARIVPVDIVVVMRLHWSFVPVSVVLAALAVNVAAISRPIIGILAQEVYPCAMCTTRNQTYIAASYVKFVEQAGARVAPIFVERERSYYVNIFNSVNGILLPGGDVDALHSSYGKAGTILYELAMEAHKNGTHFPLWGTCLGLELLARVAVGGQQVLKKCHAQGVGMPLTFAKGIVAFYDSSR
ncbi:hypothetical protein HPB50_001751 [Hyalomma asiaticum]|uniref:Uncharacterized protein n=1 Tax=Hyalomma asiaticum TaxID=266040 RepID=A0ACB7T3Y2_HYAAI|nr:hypothetical protein HPB50_001751 [Hyalomma asiaticum]